MLISMACSGVAQTAMVPSEPTSFEVPPSGDAASQPKTISIQDMLVTGPSNMKLYSLAMITQGKQEGDIDSSYLPGFAVCAADPALPIRSVTARLLGQHYVEGKETPDPEAVALLIKLARDTAEDVQYNAVYFGLARMKNKSDEILNLMIDVAAANREQGLYDRITQSLNDDRDRLIAILDRRLEEGNDIAMYEIYEDLTGKKPVNADKYLTMPSSRPRLFIFKVEGSDPEAVRDDLEKALQECGLTNPNIIVSEAGDSFVLLLRTYITKDYIEVKKAFADHPRFKITQDMWLTPQMEIQIDALRDE